MAHPFLATACNAARLSGATCPASFCGAFDVYTRSFEALEQAKVLKCYAALYCGCLCLVIDKKRGLRMFSRSSTFTETDEDYCKWLPTVRLLSAQSRHRKRNFGSVPTRVMPTPPHRTNLHNPADCAIPLHPRTAQNQRLPGSCRTAKTRTCSACGRETAATAARSLAHSPPAEGRRNACERMQKGRG